jgi:hypothetical protein
MAQISSKLNFILSASANGFTSGLQKAERAIKSVAKQGKAVAGELNTAIGGALTGIGTAAVGAAVGGLALMVRLGLNSADELQKLSQNLGLTTDKLAGLQWAAKLANVSNETLTSGLTKMSVTIGKAAQGSKGAAEALAKLGLSGQELMANSPDQNLKIIADRLKNVSTYSERAAIMTEIFGKSAGPELAALLADGGDALQAAADEAAAFGFNLSQIDAERLNIVNDNLDRTQMALTAVSQQVAIGLSPLLDIVLDQLLGLGKEAQKSGGIAGLVSALVTDGLFYMGETLDYLSIGWKAFKAAGVLALQGLLYPVQLLLDGLAAVANYFDVVLPDSVIRGLDSAANSLHGFRDELGETVDQLGDEMTKIWEGPSSGTKAVVAFQQAQQKMTAEAQRQNDKLKEKIALQQAFVDKEEKPKKEKKEPKEKAVKQELSLLQVGTDAAARFAFSIANDNKSIAMDQLEEAKKTNETLDDIKKNTENEFDVEEVEF